MKNIKALTFITTAALLVFLAACNKMEDFHSKYIKDGEIIYTTKLDSVKTYAGYQRVQITGLLKEAFGVKEIIIYWNDRQDSLITSYSKESDLDTISIIIPDLEEKSYLFEIYTSDGAGHRSVMVQAFATSYGERYRSALYPRTVKTYYIQDADTLGMHFLPADELELHSEVRYTDTSGSEIVLNISTKQAIGLLPAYASGVDIRSWYLPEKTAIDSFPSDWKTTEVGIYHSSGVFNHPLTGPRNFSMDKAVVRLDERTFETDYADMGQYGYRMKLRVLDNNNVLVMPVGETPSNLEPDGESTYDPVAEKFELKTKYEATLGYRNVTETLVKK